MSVRREGIRLIQSWREDWNKFIREAFGVRLDTEQQAIVTAVQHERMVAVASGTARGKDFVSACIALSFLYLTPRWNKRGELVHNTKVALTAPCYDDKTEILTDSGWKLFKDLLPEDKVAQLGTGNMIEFVTPLDYIVAPYNGDMIGCASKLVDFLVTPKHRCLFKSQMANDFSVRQAGEIYGMYGQFVKLAKWKESEPDADLDWFEFLGFWFAEGSAQFDENSRRYRITLTQNGTEYVDDLLKRNSKHFRNTFHRYPKKSGGYNWELYQKDMAAEFVAYGKALTKKLPRWIKEAGTEELLAFLKGYHIGDGSTDKNGCRKLCTSSRELANDLHEIAVKAGLIANFKEYTTRRRVVLHGADGRISGWKHGEGIQTYYEVKLSKRGEYPKVTKRHWYKEAYNGYVYCVKVPSGMVMVRRNGYNHWSGNTDRQVKNIMMPEVARLFKRAKRRGVELVGKLNAYDIRTDNEEWFLTGFKADDNNREAWSGFHAVNTMFIVTEASGISELVYESIEGNLQGNSRLLLVFNPNHTSGYAYRAMRSERFKAFHLNSLNAENVVRKKNVIPGQVDYEWVADKVQAWATPIAEGEARAEQDDFCFEGQWYRPDDLFRVKVLGQFPMVSEDTLVPPQWVELAVERWHATETPPRAHLREHMLGVDVAGMGRDATVLCERRGEYVFPLRVIHSGGTANHMEVAGLIRAERERYAKSLFVSIDTIGEGAGVYARAVEQETDKARIISCKYSEGAGGLTDTTGQYKFKNMRAYLFWAVREWLNPKNQRGACLPPEPKLLEELTEVRWYFASDGAVQIEPKEDLRKRLGRSTDLLDALANTFYPARRVPDRTDIERLAGIVY